jgi:DNA polymerase I-like protein with 3'-5' exonuclease and polymerase domains
VTIMVDGCLNCHKDKSTHMEDGSCLFEPTKFKPFPPPYMYTVTGRLSSKEPNISTLPRSRPSAFFDKIRNFFR